MAEEVGFVVTVEETTYDTDTTIEGVLDSDTDSTIEGSLPGSSYLKQPLPWHQSPQQSPSCQQYPMQQSPQEQQTTQQQPLLQMPSPPGHSVHSNPTSMYTGDCHKPNEMENKSEWYMWSIQRAVNKAFEELSQESVSKFCKQLQRILSG